MSRTEQHIYKGIGWYLYNGELIELIKEQIIFVGRLEFLEYDLEEHYITLKKIFPQLKTRLKLLR